MTGVFGELASMVGGPIHTLVVWAARRTPDARDLRVVAEAAVGRVIDALAR